MLVVPSPAGEWSRLEEPPAWWVEQAVAAEVSERLFCRSCSRPLLDHGGVPSIMLCGEDLARTLAHAPPSPPRRPGPAREVDPEAFGPLHRRLRT